MKTASIPRSTVARLSSYIRGLEVLSHQGLRLTSSQRLAQVTGVEAAQIRRDLSYVGAFGTPGVGYDIHELRDELLRFLGMSNSRPVALVGYGKLGSSLAAYGGLRQRNLEIAAIFDSDPRKIGIPVGNLKVFPPTEIPPVVRRLAIEIAILATPAAAAQAVADLLVSAGVTALLNLTPATLLVPQGVAIRSVDLADELQLVSFKGLHGGQHAAAETPLQTEVWGRQSGPLREAYI